MSTLSPYTATLGTLIFCLSYVFIAFKIPSIPIGRVCGTLVCAVLAVLFQILAPEAALAAINLDTLALLFGTMVMTILLEREGFFDIAQKILTYKCNSAVGLLGRISTVSGVLAALITNDTVCVFLTPIVIQLCERYDLPHGPYLLALATSSNIGSACSPTGNPQNMIIASLSGLKFGQFISANILAVVVSMLINLGLLIAMYRKVLIGTTFTATNAKFIREPESEEYVNQTTGKRHSKNNDSEVSISGKGRVSSKSDGATNVELNDIQVTPTHANGIDKRLGSNGLSMAATADRMNGELGESDGDPELPSTGLNHMSAHTLRQRNHSSGRQQSNTGPSEHSSGDIVIKRLEDDSVADDERMKASEIMKLPVREASADYPRQLKRRLVMVESCVRFDITQDPVVAPIQRTTKQSLAHYSRHPNKLTIFTVTLIGVIAAFGAGSPLEWASVGGAAFMLLVDWQEPDETLQKVDWSLLVFFAALFMVVQALNNTGIPSLVVNALIPYMDVSTVTGLLVYMAIILVGSNTVSNVPLVLILGPFIPTFTSPTASWLILAYVSTVAGNLTLVGSVANLIVAGRAKNIYFLGFGEYLYFGAPSTIIYTIVGSFLVWILVK